MYADSYTATASTYYFQVNGTFTDIDHTWFYKASLNKFKGVEGIDSDHNRIIQDINKNKIFLKLPAI